MSPKPRTAIFDSEYSKKLKRKINKDAKHSKNEVIKIEHGGVKISIEVSLKDQY